MSRVLFAWIGNTDLRALTEEEQVGVGPIAQAAAAGEYDRVTVLTDYQPAKVKPYVTWLQQRTSARVEAQFRPLSGPTNFADIYRAAREVVTATIAGDQQVQPVFHLSPGTPAMAAVWIILAKTRFAAELIESSRQHGVQSVSVPLDIAAEFVPDLLRSSDRQLETAALAGPPEAPEFADILCRSRVMKRVIGMARHVAPRSVPVLLQGESGTGKELFARAIHRASPRRDMPFVPINCGAIPSELVESELFGHERGAFTGADRLRPGCFENADTGTLFLDEVGELPLPAQVKLLRVLQDSEVRRIGAKQPKKIDVRIIAATNRNLMNEVTAGRFRPDLFYRLAVAVINLPPLREREGDIGLLTDRLLEQIDRESASEQGYRNKKLSPGARKLLLQHRWPGNVRELLNALRRAAIWTTSDDIRAEDVKEALLPDTGAAPDSILDRPLGNGLKLPDVLEEVARHYLERALDEAGGNKTVAAKLIGLPSYQTLSNWLKRFGVGSGTKRAM